MRRPCRLRNPLELSGEGEELPRFPLSITLGGSGFTDWVVSSALGFLTGSVAAGAAVYYFILGEYRTANEMLTEDIYVRLSLPLSLPLARGLSRIESQTGLWFLDYHVYTGVALPFE